MKNISAVEQEDPMGCGIACVAVATGKKYNEAKELFLEKKHAKARGYYCREIVAALNKAGLNYGYKKRRGSGIRYETGTIVFVRRCAKYPRGHFLIKIGKVWVDSWVNFPKYPIRGGFHKKLPGYAQYIIFNT